ncbi:hypothetical protein BRD56_02120 [Thermoplasmatales archaeon SW_10_69_26]|nr:MAG: hypothetical protein BRD56_02120 [Thermoplasmatales archaeon SW_10_69_26]
MVPWMDRPDRFRRRGETNGRLPWLALVAGLVLLAAGVAAHASDEHGELTFHDEQDGDATRSLSCEFWVRAEGFEATNGTLAITHDGDGNHTHTVANWSANGTDRFHLGPLSHHDHDAGQAWLQANLSGNHSTQAYAVNHTACEETPADEEPLPGESSEPCDGPPEVDAYHDGLAIVVHWGFQDDADGYLVNRSVQGERNFTTIAQLDQDETDHRDANVDKGTTYTYIVTVLDEDGDPGRPCDHVQITARDTRPPPCPSDVQAQPQEGGAIELAWSGSAQADAYKIYRATGNGSLGKIQSVQEPGYVDENTEEDQTYRYRVVGADEDGESEDCPILEATAIPTFPTTATVGFAIVGSVACLALARRRG